MNAQWFFSSLVILKIVDFDQNEARNVLNSVFELENASGTSFHLQLLEFCFAQSEVRLLEICSDGLLFEYIDEMAFEILLNADLFDEIAEILIKLCMTAIEKFPLTIVKSDLKKVIANRNKVKLSKKSALNRLF